MYDLPMQTGHPNGVRSSDWLDPNELDCALLPVIWMTGCMTNCSNDNALVADKVCNVVGKSGNVNAPKAALTFALKKGMTHNSRAGTFNFHAKSNTQTRNALLVKLGCFLRIIPSLW